MRIRSIALLLAAFVPAALLAAPVARAQNTTYYRVTYRGGFVDGLPPLAAGPITVTGSFSSTGSQEARVDQGRFRAYASVSNPQSGGVTPQIDGGAGGEILAGDVQVLVDTALAAPLNIPLTLHTLVSGSLTHEGLNPFTTSVSVRVYGGGQVTVDDLGSMTLGASSLERLGPLASAPLVMVDEPVDFPLTLTAWPGFFNSLDFSLNVYAGGTSAGTTINSGTADFAGNGWRFPTLTPAFEVPAGVHVNVPSLNIVDNSWVDPVAGVTPAVTSGRLALATLRNPARGIARFALTLPADGASRAEVFDVRGRRVATLLDGWQAAGRRELAWDGAGDAGAGVYFVRVSSVGQRATTRIVVVK
jgi:hypothetical protein